jgi:hypothetical protein
MVNLPTIEMFASILERPRVIQLLFPIVLGRWDAALQGDSSLPTLVSRD